MKKIIKRFIIAGFIATLIFFPLVGFTQNQSGELENDPGGLEDEAVENGTLCADGSQPVNGKCEIQNPAPNYLFEFGDFDSLLMAIINILLYFAGGIAVLFLIIGGFQYMAARGNEEATAKAKKTISGAVIGVVVVVLAFAIVTMVNNLLIDAEGRQGNSAPLNNNNSQNNSGNSAILGFRFSNSVNICVVNVDCNVQIGSVTGGTPPFFTSTGSVIPPGLRISRVGRDFYIVGVGSEPGTYNIGFRITDDQDRSIIVPPFTFTVE